MGRVDLAVALLDEIEATGWNLVESITGHANEKNLSEMAEAAHSLKGAAGILAAEPLRLLAAQLEAAGEANDAQGVARLVESLRNEMQRCLAAVPALREQRLGARK